MVVRYVVVGVGSTSNHAAISEDKPSAARLVDQFVAKGLAVSDIIEVEVPPLAKAYRHRFISNSDAYGNEVIAIQSDRCWAECQAEMLKDMPERRLTLIESVAL